MRRRPPLPVLLALLGPLACSKQPDAPTQAAPTTGQAPEAAPAVTPVAGARIDYNRDVQPILSNYCYHCHGPDTASRKAGLRLDLRDQALSFKSAAGKRTIVPGKPDESELVRRIESHDPDEMMPQDKEKLLNPAQIKLLREWIRQGAEFRDHWAFEAPAKAPPPKVSSDAWCKNDVDRFVLAKLDEAGLKPNPEADRRSLIRRVTLDLIGLLPTPAETEAFVADAADTDTAYAKVVDRLLADPRYGEHRARYWLDYTRYGDTHGIHVDPYRSIWPFRDYLIQSLTADKPFDRFTTEMLAGDLLPDCTQDALVASAYPRVGVSTGEGGTIVEENWNYLLRERIEAYGATFMGLTTGCAVCHDHKYDPLSLRDTYALAAFFGNQTEKSWTQDFHYWPPYQVLPRAEARPDFEAALARRAKAEAELRTLGEREAPAIAGWLKTGPRTVDAGLAAWFPFDENQGTDVHEKVGGKTWKIASAPPAWDTYPLFLGSCVLGNNSRLQVADAGDFGKEQAFTVSGWFRPYEVVSHSAFGSNSGTLLSRMDGKALRGWDLFDENNRLAMHLIHQWPGNAIKVSGPALPRPEWSHVTVSYDGSGKAAGVKMYLDGKPAATQVNNDSLTGDIRTGTPLNFARRGGPDDSAVPARQTGFQDVRLYDRVLTPDEVALLPFADPAARILARKPDYLAKADVKAAHKAGTDPFAKAWTPFEREAAKQAYFAAFPDKVAALRKERDEANKAMHALSEAKPDAHPPIGDVAAALQSQYDGKHGALTLVSREREEPAFAHVLGRGDYATLGERTYPDTPSFLPPMAAGAPRNRLGLAQWTVDKDNPLTARVTVNRAWQELFGTGLVETSEDFGIVGIRPSHPQLLDWLAVDFRDGGGAADQAWRFKRLYRMLVLSATYRQSAAIPKDKLEKDPANLLLARGPRFRLDAEVLRDCALQAGGILNTDKIGGPSFMGYLPAGVLSSVYPSNTTTGAQHHGPMLYRRSMYRLIKRMVPTPEMEVFDGSDRLAACARRNRTNTPLAALTLMNDVTFVEAARCLAEAALKQAGAGDDATLDWMAARVLSRPLAAEERQALLAVRDAFTKDLDPAKAKGLLAIGETKRDETLDPVRHAAWTGVAGTLMNSDEAINK